MASRQTCLRVPDGSETVGFGPAIIHECAQRSYSLHINAIYHVSRLGGEVWGPSWSHNGLFVPQWQTPPRVQFCVPQTSRTPESKYFSHMYLYLGWIYDLCVLEQLHLLAVCTG